MEKFPPPFKMSGLNHRLWHHKDWGFKAVSGIDKPVNLGLHIGFSRERIVQRKK
jgi:hypothetical protein